MIQNKLVSVITPCYNGAEFVHRLLDSLLAQTYKKLEIIFVNDGSTDETESVVKEYIPRFEQLGIKFIYIYQENAGQAAALNNGLKIFTGEYLMWPDSDDYLSNDAISLMLSFLEEKTTYSIVRSNGYLVEETTNKIMGEFAQNNVSYDKINLFDDCFFEKDYWYCPIAFMARSSFFLKSNPLRDIYASRGGQNWQMMLPLLYKQKCGYISEPIFFYSVRNSSHSRETVSFESQIERRNMHKTILTETLSRIEMDSSDLKQYLYQLEQKYYKIRCDIYLTSSQYKLAKVEYNKIDIVNRSRYLNLKYKLRGNKILLKFVSIPYRLIKYFYND